MMHLFRWMCFFAGVTVVCAAVAQPRVYRCDDATYTNQPQTGQRCTPIAPTAVTVIEGTRVNGVSASGAAGQKTLNQPDPPEQKQRDAQAVAVLHAELQKAQNRYAEVLKQWNQGEPERMADEYKQPAKYQERVTQLRAALQRSEADVLGLQRELARQTPGTVAGTKP